MVSVFCFIFFFPVCDNFAVVVDDDVEEAEGEDGDDHVVPLHVGEDEDEEGEDAVAEEVGFEEEVGTVGAFEQAVFDFASNIGVAEHELNEGGDQEKGCADEQCFIELSVCILVLLLQSFHHPQ